MKRGSRLLLICIAGLAAGMAGMALFRPEPSRGARMVALFEEHCVPFARTRDAPDPTGLERWEDVPGAPLWVDTRSGIALAFDASSCQVSDDLGYIPAEDQGVVDTAVMELVPRAFPELQPSDDHDAASWDRFLVWMQYPKDDPRNWTVLLHRFAPTGPEAATILRVGFKPD